MTRAHTQPISEEQAKEVRDMVAALNRGENIIDRLRREFPTENFERLYQQSPSPIIEPTEYKVIRNVETGAVLEVQLYYGLWEKDLYGELVIGEDKVSAMISFPKHYAWIAPSKELPFGLRVYSNEPHANIEDIVYDWIKKHRQEL